MNLLFGECSAAQMSFLLPKPYPDELLYSILARAAYRNAHWSPKGLMGAAFGDQTVLASPDLPSQLNLLAGAAGRQWQISSSDIALRHTLAGYYTHFLGKVERERILGLMAGKSANLHLRLGICSGNVRAPKKFILCPICTELDVELHGETYWRRSHHLPGVLVCPMHKVSLVETVVPFRPLGRHEHIHARVQHLEQATPLLSKSRAAGFEELLALAQAAAGLLDAAVCAVGPVHDYRQHLHPRGFKGASGVQELWSSLARCFGNEVLQKLFRGNSDEREPAWLLELFRKPRRPLHPLKHLLVERVLLDHEVRTTTQSKRSGKTWGIFKNPGLRHQAHELSKTGLTVNAVATRLNLDWKTACRLLQPLPVVLRRVDNGAALVDRTAWRVVSEKNPALGRTQLRRLEPALYARLYRNDRDWLMRQGTRQKCKAATSRVYWPSRDESLSQSVQALAMEIRQRNPLRRVSASHVLGILGARTTVARNSDKLPLTQAALAQHCESVEEFQLRRIQAEQAADGWFPRPIWRVLRAAHLNSARLPDKGVDIVARAQHMTEHQKC